jgi:preprotein translocase subunit SecD
MKKIMFIISIILGSFSMGIAQIHSDMNQDTSNSNKVVNNRQVGFYLVAAEADSVVKLPAPSTEQRLVRYDYKFLRDTERGKPLYLLLPKNADVSLMLSKTPELKDKGENGFPELRLELTPEAANKLEKLTREHLGGKVAFVIDGEPVTLHKIRSIITGGQFRLSRCTDTACQYIYGRLVEKQ